jgi:hypothetical protein
LISLELFCYMQLVCYQMVFTVEPTKQNEKTLKFLVETKNFHVGVLTIAWAEYK